MAGFGDILKTLFVKGPKSLGQGVGSGISGLADILSGGQAETTGIAQTQSPVVNFPGGGANRIGTPPLVPGPPAPGQGGGGGGGGGFDIKKLLPLLAIGGAALGGGAAGGSAAVGALNEERDRREKNRSQRFLEELNQRRVRLDEQREARIAANAQSAADLERAKFGRLQTRDEVEDAESILKIHLQTDQPIPEDVAKAVGVPTLAGRRLSDFQKQGKLSPETFSRTRVDKDGNEFTQKFLMFGDPKNPNVVELGEEFQSGTPKVFNVGQGGALATGSGKAIFRNPAPTKQAGEDDDRTVELRKRAEAAVSQLIRSRNAAKGGLLGEGLPPLKPETIGKMTRLFMQGFDPAGDLPVGSPGFDQQMQILMALNDVPAAGGQAPLTAPGVPPAAPAAGAAGSAPAGSPSVEDFIRKHQ